MVPFRARVASAQGVHSRAEYQRVPVIWHRVEPYHPHAIGAKPVVISGLREFVAVFQLFQRHPRVVLHPRLESEEDGLSNLFRRRIRSAGRRPYHQSVMWQI